jgi:hypothetical protein
MNNGSAASCSRSEAKTSPTGHISRYARSTRATAACVCPGAGGRVSPHAVSDGARARHLASLNDLLVHGEHRGFGARQRRLGGRNLRVRPLARVRCSGPQRLNRHPVQGARQQELARRQREVRDLVWQNVETFAHGGVQQRLAHVGAGQPVGRREPRQHRCHSRVASACKCLQNWPALRSARRPEQERPREEGDGAGAEFASRPPHGAREVRGGQAAHLAARHPLHNDVLVLLHFSAHSVTREHAGGPTCVNGEPTRGNAVGSDIFCQADAL